MGEFGGGGDIGGRAKGGAAIGEQAEEGPAARVFGVMDVEGRLPGQIGGDAVVYQPDSPQEGIGQARQAGREGGLDAMSAGHKAGCASAPATAAPGGARPERQIVRSVEDRLRLVAAQGRPDQQVVRAAQGGVGKERAVQARLCPRVADEFVHAAAQGRPPGLHHAAFDQHERDAGLTGAQDKHGRLRIGQIGPIPRLGRV